MQPESQEGEFATEYAMKLKDLTVELSGNDTLKNRSVKIGPLNDGLNFLYGENGAGKSTIRQLLADLLVDSSSSDFSASTNRKNSIDLVVECASGKYRIAQDEFGHQTSTRIDSLSESTLTSSYEAVEPQLKLDRELAQSLSFIPFRENGTVLKNLQSVIQRRFDVPCGIEAATIGHSVPVQQKLDLQTRIEAAHRDLTELRTQRSALESETATFTGDHHTIDLDRRIAELSSRLVELDPNRIRLEIESLQQESSRLRAEIDRFAVTVQDVEPSKHLTLLYRLLDEIEQQIREIRSVHSHIQRHRVRLKEEMELLGTLTIEEDSHPYHRAVEILRQIENRIDNADTRGDQWLDDHGTVDAQQVSRFLDETCRSLRGDLQTLCDELSSRYKEMHCRSATAELKELRHTYAHLTELTQQVVARREALLPEIHAADPAGAELIRQANPEFCQLAAQVGHFAARQKFLGAAPTAPVSAARDTSLQQQQLAALENRLNSLTSTLALSESESLRISGEINELKLQKQSLSSVFLAEKRERLAQVIGQTQSAEASLRILTIQLEGLNAKRTEPNPLLLKASSHLGQLTLGEYTKVWLGSGAGEIHVQNRLGQDFAVGALEERGLPQLVQLSLVLAANEQPNLNSPIILDDLFADLEKNRVDSALGVLSRWCEQHHKQAIVLTQHRFLADRLPNAPSFEIAVDSANIDHWKPVTQPLTAESTAEFTATTIHSRPAPILNSWQEEVHAGTPIAEYPTSPMPRPYPLSKYPRTSDRGRQSSAINVDYYENFTQPEVQIETAATHQNGYVEFGTSDRTSVVSPSMVGDRYSPTTVDETMLIDSIALFDNAQLRCLESNAIESVGDFLRLDPHTDSEEFAACYLAGQSLEFLQASLWLMCWVPDLSVNDAQALVACGISDPEHLLTSNIDSLYERLARFLRSPDGRRFGNSGHTPNRNSVRTWQLNLRNNRDYRRQHRPRPSRDQRVRAERQTLRAWNPSDTESSSDSRRSSSREARDGGNSRRRTVARESMPVRNPRMRTPEPSDSSSSTSALAPMEPRVPRKPAAVRSSATRQSLSRLGDSDHSGTSSSSRPRTKEKPAAQKLRFYLDLSDHIEAAPSIGPKTAARFEAIGVHTIEDFLKMTSEAMAEKLNYKRLSANLIRQYQNQTRMVCRIPNLRGHDAQLLVGCGIIEPEELASMRPEALFAKIAPFSDTKEGLKIIRNGKKPDLEEVTDWISFAQHNRSLQAA